MMDELVASRGPRTWVSIRQVGQELTRAFQDRAILLFDSSGNSEPEAVGDAVQLIKQYVSKDRSGALYIAARLRKILALRAQFEVVFGLAEPVDTQTTSSEGQSPKRPRGQAKGRFTETTARKFMKEHLEENPNTTMAEAIAAARETGKTGERNMLRTAYRDEKKIRGIEVRPGRRSKSAKS